MATEKNNPQTGPFLGVIFGASGDLAKRKLMPAIFSLSKDGLLSPSFAILGMSRREMTDEEFRQKIVSDMDELAPGELTDAMKKELIPRFFYIAGDVTDPETYGRLKARMTDIEKQCATQGNAFFYLATAPTLFSPVIHALGKEELITGTADQWRRVVIEKPFGHDLQSAEQLNADIQHELNEDQIYRIDHYLGKETVQNIAVLRFANGMFQPFWSNLFIDHVQVTVAETLGVEARGGYYEHAGALRDMIPNHILQLLSLIAMEMPLSFGADDMRNEQVKVLRAIRPLQGEGVSQNVVRGQYVAGAVDGKELVAYCDEDSVDPESLTETYVAMRLSIDNQRWAGVPFYLRTGKRLAERVTEIVVEFKKPPFTPFRETTVDSLEPNQLIIRIQPDEGISLRFVTKVPGTLLELDEVDMEFRYADYFGRTPATGYDRLLYDCIRGEATLFRRADMVEAGWRAIAGVQAEWGGNRNSLTKYASGSWGPIEADELLARDGRQWRVYV
jgi:glucose-6-phosphate 1-dehydrogenase